MTTSLAPEAVPGSPPVSRPPVSRHAVTFVLITVFLDMVGFGIIMRCCRS